MDTREYWNEVANRGDRAITPGTQWDPKHVENEVNDLLWNIPVEVLSNATLLEIGCGEGRLMMEIAPRVKKYVGVDISDIVLQRADAHKKSKGIPNIDLILINQELLDERYFGTYGRFDVIVAWTVFMHLPREIFLNYLSKCYEILKYNGHFNFQMNDEAEHDSIDSNHKFNHRFDAVLFEDRWNGRWYPEWLLGQYFHSIGFDIISMPNHQSKCWRLGKL